MTEYIITNENQGLENNSGFTTMTDAGDLLFGVWDKALVYDDLKEVCNQAYILSSMLKTDCRVYEKIKAYDANKLLTTTYKPVEAFVIYWNLDDGLEKRFYHFTVDFKTKKVGICHRFDHLQDAFVWDDEKIAKTKMHEIGYDNLSVMKLDDAIMIVVQDKIKNKLTAA